jgi:hypothetical protein
MCWATPGSRSHPWARPPTVSGCWAHQIRRACTCGGCVERESLAGVDLALLMAVAAPGRWVATFMVPTASPSTTIEEQLEDLTHMSPVAMGP